LEKRNRNIRESQKVYPSLQNNNGKYLKIENTGKKTIHYWNGPYESGSTTGEKGGKKNR